jgi:hypothetical protein
MTTESFGYSTANPAHAAIQIIRGESAFVAAMNAVIRRSAVYVPSPPAVTTMGLEVTKTFTILEAELPGGASVYELLIDGQPVWTGAADDRADGLLNALLAITGDAPEVPNN